MRYRASERHDIACEGGGRVLRDLLRSSLCKWWDAGRGMNRAGQGKQAWKAATRQRQPGYRGSPVPFCSGFDAIRSRSNVGKSPPPLEMLRKTIRGYPVAHRPASGLAEAWQPDEFRSCRHMRSGNSLRVWRSHGQIPAQAWQVPAHRCGCQSRPGGPDAGA